MKITDKLGINAQRGEVTAADLEAFQSAGFHAVRFQCGGGHTPTTVHAYRSRGARILHARIHVDDMNVVTRSAENFTAGRSAHVQNMLAAGVGVFEIHTQPNTARHGFGLSWSTPLEFADWFMDALGRLREMVGADRARFGFPALAPGPADPRDFSPFTLEAQRIAFVRGFASWRRYFGGVDVEANLEDFRAREIRVMVQLGAVLEARW